jgi:hypothetical protein
MLSRFWLLFADVLRFLAARELANKCSFLISLMVSLLAPVSLDLYSTPVLQAGLFFSFLAPEKFWIADS